MAPTATPIPMLSCITALRKPLARLILLRRNLRVGQRSHAGELHRSEGSVEEENGDDQDGCGGRAKQRAKRHGYGGNDSVHDENAAEAKAAKSLDDKRLHTQVSGEQRQQVEA